MLTVSKNREQVCMSQFAGQAVRKLLKDPLGRQLRCTEFVIQTDTTRVTMETKQNLNLEN